MAEAVDTHLQAFRDAFDDQAAWDPVKQSVAALSGRGVGFTDQQAVQDAIGAER